jgi:hypothetical protein
MMVSTASENTMIWLDGRPVGWEIIDFDVHTPRERPRTTVAQPPLETADWFVSPPIRLFGVCQNKRLEK